MVGSQAAFIAAYIPNPIRPARATHRHARTLAKLSGRSEETRELGDQWNHAEAARERANCPVALDDDSVLPTRA
jgi:hypothetical protein